MLRSCVFLSTKASVNIVCKHERVLKGEERDARQDDPPSPGALKGEERDARGEPHGSVRMCYIRTSREECGRSEVQCKLNNRVAVYK